MEPFTSGRFQPAAVPHHRMSVDVEDIDPFTDPHASSSSSTSHHQSSSTHKKQSSVTETDVPPPSYSEKDPHNRNSKRFSTLSQTFHFDPDHRRGSHASDNHNLDPSSEQQRKPSIVESFKLGWNIVHGKNEPAGPHQRAQVEAAEFQHAAEHESPPELPTPARRMSKTGGYVASHASKDAMKDYYAKENWKKEVSIVGSTKGEPRNGSVSSNVSADRRASAVYQMAADPVSAQSKTAAAAEGEKGLQPSL